MLADRSIIQYEIIFYIGKYTVNPSLLKEPPSEFLVREINEKWVGVIKESIRRSSAPLGATTIFPVLIDPQQVNINKA